MVRSDMGGNVVSADVSYRQDKMGKRIEVTDTLAVSFDQRARGEETPWWIGRFWRKEGRSWKEVGTFENTGTGGSTFVNPPALEAELTDAIQALGVDYKEVADTFCYYAESLAYELGVDRSVWTLEDHIDLTWQQPMKGFREGNAERYAAANRKFERLLVIKKAQSAAKRGKTIVRQGNDYYTYRTRDRAVIERSLTARKVTDWEIIA